MTDREVVLTVRSAAVVGAGLALVGTVVSLVAGNIGDWWSGHYGVATEVTVGLCVVVWLVISRQPRNAAVWALAASPLGGLVVLAYSVAPFLADAEPSALRYPNYIPADQPALVAWLFMVAEPATTIGVFVPVTFGLLLFPTGSLPGRRWRWVGWLAAASIAAVCVAYVIAERPGATRSPEGWDVLGAAQSALLVAMFLSIVAVFVRFRSSSGEARQQCKWVLWGGAIAALAFGVGIILVDASDPPLPPILIFSGFLVLIVSYGVAIARYRLYDVDLVISRTIVYGSLAAIITAFYVGAVAGIGELVGTADRPNTAVAITTTAAVAAAFQPLRRRLQRLADHIVYGKRATPHDVLSEFAKRVSANDDRLLELVARSLVEGTGASRAEVWVTVEGRPLRTVSWPPPDAAAQPEDATTFSIEHEGVVLGSLVLAVRSGQRLSEQDLVLAGQVAAGMGLALRNRALTETLERRVVEVRESRRRLVAVQDDTRRRLERDLHDGTQQQLVALRVKLGVAGTIAEKDGATETAAALRRLADRTDRVVETVRDLARGVYPPLLEAEGLGPAITAHARRATVPVTVSADGLDRYERDIESAINVCVVEALRNVEMHAGPSEAVVTIAESDGVVSFEVRDDGTGFDVQTTPRGAGLTNLADRLDALAGTLAVSSTPGRGTTVTGAIPLVAAVAT